MWKTVILLLLTLVLIPFLAFWFDDPLTVLQADILKSLVIIYLVAVAACFIISTLSRNYSQVDKLWSIMPVVYSWIICSESMFEPRILLMSVLVSAWGIRLTYNFSRRGGYSLRFWSGTEDYRWQLLRDRPEFAAGWKWVLFNLMFISLYQMGLILLITLPALKSIGGNSLSVADYILAFLIILFITVETIADQQQWNFQQLKQFKNSDVASGSKNIKGFLDTGLWSVVRHPNYAAEQAVWILFYFFSVAATEDLLNWSVIGPVLLILLFYGSSNFSESVSSSKYPEYADYIKKVPRFIPFIK